MSIKKVDTKIQLEISACHIVSLKNWSLHHAVLDSPIRPMFKYLHSKELRNEQY